MQIFGSGFGYFAGNRRRRTILEWSTTCLLRHCGGPCEQSSIQLRRSHRGSTGCCCCCCCWRNPSHSDRFGVGAYGYRAVESFDAPSHFLPGVGAVQSWLLQIRLRVHVTFVQCCSWHGTKGPPGVPFPNNENTRFGGVQGECQNHQTGFASGAMSFIILGIGMLSKH